MNKIPVKSKLLRLPPGSVICAPDIQDTDLYRHALVWQDCLLSLCYGRSATATEPPQKLPRHRVDRLQGGRRTEYRDCLWHLSESMLLHLGPRSTALESQEQFRTSVKQIEDIHDLVAIPASDARQTSKARLEFHSLKLYSSFVISFLCQQRLRRLRGGEAQKDEQSECAEKLVHTLRDSITSFLSLRSTSMVPMRIWSLKHIALSSAFLLSFRSDLKQHPTNLQTVEALINAFSTIIEDGVDNGLGTLNEPHLRALRVLREICSKKVPEEVVAREEEPDRDLSPLFPQEAPVSGNVNLSNHMRPTGLDDVYFGNPAAALDSFWDDDFFSMITGNANIASNDILDGLRTDTWTQL